MRDNRRDTVEALKAEEKANAEADVYNWKKEKEQGKGSYKKNSTMTKSKVFEEDEDDDDDEEKEAPPSRDIWTPAEVANADKGRATANIPPPRAQTTTRIEFDWSERASKTPAREDVDKDRDMYLERARRAKELADQGAGKVEYLAHAS